MALSSNSLLHFTKDFNSLKGILSQTFKVKYCREKIITKEKGIDILVPMVSFCDIPFSQVLTHVKSYKSYGIGLSKAWALKKGLTPVLYIEKQSSFGSTFFDSLFEKIQDEQSGIKKMGLNSKQLLDIVRYVKNYQGDLDRNVKKIKKNYRYSDEREWRYVLPPSHSCQFIGNCNSFGNNHKTIGILKENLNSTIAQEYLGFAPEDISYIIIRSEKERDKTIKAIRNIKDVHGQLLVSRIASRIISVEQIKGDY